MTTRLLNIPSLPKWWKKELNIFIIVLISTLLHAWAVWQLPDDYDEPVYLQAGSGYADLIRDGNLRGIVNFPDNREHPPLVKILYGLPFLLFPQQENVDFYLYAARGISAVFGVLAVFLIARKNAWAGLLFALHSMTLKYSSQAYLEALPMLMTVVSTLALEKAVEGREKFLWISAAALGTAVAAKYPYALIVIPLIWILARRRKFGIRQITAYFVLAGAVFLALNPHLWGNPPREIAEVFSFHTAYSQSQHVQSSDYPWYQPLLFLSSSVSWHPQVFFFLTSDELMFGLALAGLYFEVRERSWMAAWSISAILFLLLWPTKWPQYTLLLTPVMAMMAGCVISRAIAWIKPREDYWNYLEEMLPQPPKITWWLLAVFVLSLGVGKVMYEYQLAVARQGWETFHQDNAPLPSNWMTQINTEEPGTVAIGTQRGLSLWFLDDELALWGQEPLTYTTTNSNLNSNDIRSIAFDPQEQAYWLGTKLGVSKLTSGIQNFTKEQIGCLDCTVNDLAVDSKGRLWVAAKEGIYLYEDQSWLHFTAVNPGLESEVVLSVWVQEANTDEVLWAGTLAGISKIDLPGGAWQNENWAGQSYGWGGVSEIGQTAAGELIACTQGGGIGRWDGESWAFTRNSNAPFKSNTVITFAEDVHNNLWFGFAYPTEPGGYLMRLDSQQNWLQYFYNTSGFEEGEPMDLAFDARGRLWVATNGKGLQIYQPRN